jgi:hypothetical protein
MHCVALLEQDEMLDALDGHLAAALRGEGRLVLVTGEAGVRPPRGGPGGHRGTPRREHHATVSAP